MIDGTMQSQILNDHTTPIPIHSKVSTPAHVVMITSLFSKYLFFFKVNEIAFINTLEAQNKKIEVLTRHQVWHKNAYKFIHCFLLYFFAFIIVAFRYFHCQATLTSKCYYLPWFITLKNILISAGPWSKVTRHSGILKQARNFGYLVIQIWQVFVGELTRNRFPFVRNLERSKHTFQT